MADKTTTAGEVVAELSDGMTIGIGGWGSRRKPMALVRAILRSPVKDLTVVSYGGPDVGLLCAAGKVRRVVFGFVTLDSVPYDPWFGYARQSGQIEVPSTTRACCARRSPRPRSGCRSCPRVRGWDPT